MNLVEDFLASADLSTAPASVRHFQPAGSIVLTPRFRHSRYVVTLLCDAAGRPRLVGKTSRVPHDPGTLGAEFDMLGAVAARAGEGFAPTPIALARHRGHWTLLQTAMSGRAMAHGGPSPAKVWTLVDAWLLRLARASATVESANWFDQATADLIHALSRSVLARDGARFCLTEQLARPFQDIRVPRPVEHGDLVASNVLLPHRRAVAVIDWELGRLRGIPGADATLFLASQQFFADGADAAPDKVASYRRHFLGSDGRGRMRLASHLEAQGVDPVWIDQILLATWVRYTLTAFARAMPGLSTAAEEALVVEAVPPGAWWGAALWLATLDHLAGTGVG